VGANPTVGSRLNTVGRGLHRPAQLNVFQNLPELRSLKHGHGQRLFRCVCVVVGDLRFASIASKASIWASKQAIWIHPFLSKQHLSKLALSEVGLYRGLRVDLNWEVCILNLPVPFSLSLLAEDLIESKLTVSATHWNLPNYLNYLRAIWTYILVGLW